MDKVWDGNVLANLNIYIIVDPAGTKKKKADYTTMWVLGLGADKNYYILDIIRDKLDLTGKTNKLFGLVRQFTVRNRKPLVYYEKVSMQSDIEHIQYVMNQTNYRFAITAASSTIPKGQRIDALEPYFREARIWFPLACWHVNWEGAREDMLSSFIKEEYKLYPFCSHDDGLDALSRIADDQTGTEMAFPDEQSVEMLTRFALEEKGFQFDDAEVIAEYEPL